MTVSNDVEREVKLAIDIGADLPDLRELVSASVRQPEQVLRSVYFDSADLRLWERGITLRYRTGEGTPKWTLKLPRPPAGGATVRTEVEWEGEEDRVPQAALEAVSGIVRRAPLHVVAELNTDRIRFELQEDGLVRAEMASDIVRVVGGRKDGLRFRQLELELTTGGGGQNDLTKTVVKALRRAGARPDPHPKLHKVLGPPKRLRELGPKSSAEEVLRHAVSTGLGRLLDHDCRIRVAGPDADPEDVHQARVATRRLRSDLATLKPLLDPVWVDHVRGELRSAGAALGAVRDSDVLMEGVLEAGAGESLIRMLAEERASAVVALRPVMNGRAYMDLLDRLHAASVSPPVSDRGLARRKASRVLPPLVNRKWKKLRREVHKGGQRPTDDRLHEIRKRAKQLRYASELSGPVSGKAAERTAKRSESIQTILGEHHDAVVASQWLVQAGNRGALGGAGAAGDLAGLIAREYERKDRLAREWRSHYKRLARPRRRAWLRGA